MSQTYTIIILLSGNGTNLQAIIDADLPVNIAAVISDNHDAYGLQRADSAGIPTFVVPSTDYNDRQSYDHALRECIDPLQPQLILLSGFMRILTPDFVNAYKNKIINIHPSLLPKYPGLKTYQQAIDNGDAEHGTTIHYVTPELDDGPIIAQRRIAIQSDDTSETLKQRTQAVEHCLFPEVIKWFAEGRMKITERGS